ncbi:DUF4190 domain-containing protein [Streptomyces sp. NPDC052114]|uniref:DUF4190 domain-containing protein n=1 Tax=unclassified Streptomyces TaxID=2593676 RepID=UPI0034290CDD
MTSSQKQPITPAAPSDSAYVAVAPVKTSGKSIASMVLGVVSLVIPFIGIITGPLAIVFSLKGKKEALQCGEGRDGFATAGLVLGILGCVAYGLLLLLLILSAIVSI